MEEYLSGVVNNSLAFNLDGRAGATKSEVVNDPRCVREPEFPFICCLGFRTLGGYEGRIKARRAPNRYEKWQDGAHTDGQCCGNVAVASVHGSGASVLSPFVTTSRLELPVLYIEYICRG